MCQSLNEKVRLYRPLRGTFGNWKRYSILSGGTKVGHVAGGELVELGPDIGNGTIRVGTGAFISSRVSLSEADGRNLICELSANPKVDKESMRLYWVSDDELLQKTWRFDKWPSFGGKGFGIVRSLLAITLVGALGIWMIVGAIIKSANHPFDIFVYGPVALFAAGICWFGAACGIRAMYHYFRMPPELRK